jgi:hypothetical protein
MLGMSLEAFVALVAIFVQFVAVGMVYALSRAWKKIDALEERVEKLEKSVVPGSYLDVNGNREEE